MKSYKKFDEKLKRANSLFLLCEISSALLKTWKTNGTKNANYSKFSNTIPYPGGYHVKANVPRIPKMWYFLCLAVLKVELLAPEVRSKFKKKNYGNAVFKKKVTATIFGFLI